MMPSLVGTLSLASPSRKLHHVSGAGLQLGREELMEIGGDRKVRNR